MKIFRKNQLVITALAALIAVAGYLNHIEKSEQKGTLAGAKITKETESTVQPETQLETQEAQQAAGTDIESNEIDMQGEPGEAVLVNAAGTVDFIVEAKLAREEVRANTKETLKSRGTDRRCRKGIYGGITHPGKRI